MTKSGLIIEKDSGKDGDGKIYGIFSLHRPIHLTPSDTLSIGLNGVVLQGSSPRPLVSRRNMDSSAVGKNTVMESVDDDWITVNYHNTGHDLPAKETVSQILSNNTSPTNASVGSGNFEMAKDKDSDADQNKTASKLFRSQFSELRIEISFESKDVMGDWIDAIEAQAELLSTI